MMEDGYEAITKTNTWSYMERIPTDTWPDDPEYLEIFLNMKYPKHTGLTRTWVLINMSYIAKNGFEMFVESWNKNV
jgi:hypothetical protein